MHELFQNKVYWGHKKGLRNDFIAPYLFGERLGIDIIDLNKTVSLLQDALNFTAHIAYRQGVILFISRHLQTLPLVEQTAMQCEEYSHCRPWQQGTFTNATKLFGAMTRLPDLCIFINMLNNVYEPHDAIIEASKLNIPTIGIVDTSCDPRLITYPVPGNDDTPCAVELYCKLFKEAILKGKAKRKELDAKSK
jgi:small subunit ribosomal protein S2